MWKENQIQYVILYNAEYVLDVWHNDKYVYYVFILY